ncbi:aspartate kinase [Aquimarina agarilytica]|uniref:aspartate kinase n=1 Tax=Aquimarina agarilytica TaxID=1087449 RepID=UPI000288B114|nr:aspartate kinase [Aquimarina agarilytica]
MRVFKFGGASVKDAAGVKNVVSVLEKVGHKNTLVVVSAMGKTTNALEVVIEQYRDKNPELTNSIKALKESHASILTDLFKSNQHPIFNKINAIFDDLETLLQRNKSPKYDYIYDQVVSYGEIISTTILSNFLTFKGLENDWLDARTLVKTDSTYRDAKVDWETTQTAITNSVNKQNLSITQGFIGADTNNFTTTLGREGSDYSAAIFAYCLNAESVSIWKDVDGVLNGDPRVFENTKLLNQISYEEAIELAFYGASVIHPKTLQPLQQKEIPLYVKSFIHPENPGTAVSKGQTLEPFIPCFIVKKNQVLISLSSLDFSFIVEENISEIFSLFHKYQIKVDLIQNSAISFAVCVDNKFGHLQELITELKAKFKVTFEENVSLYTIRHFDKAAAEGLEKGKNILLKQLGTETYQIVTKE